MSVTSETASIAYTGNNSTVTAYAVPFTFYDAAHLVVEAKLISTGVVTTLLPTSGFIATGVGVSGGGSIRTVAAWPNTYTLTVTRRVPLTQSVVLAEGQRVPNKVIEKALDWGVMQAQRVWFYATQTAASLTAHAARADNPHAVTKAQVGLGSADNTSDADKPVSTAQATALSGKISTDEKGEPGGVATLEGNGRVPMSQLPPFAQAVASAVVWNRYTQQYEMLFIDDTDGDGVLTLRSELYPNADPEASPVVYNRITGGMELLYIDDTDGDGIPTLKSELIPNT